jgi:hypothetical protein
VRTTSVTPGTADGDEFIGSGEGDSFVAQQQHEEDGKRRSLDGGMEGEEYSYDEQYSSSSSRRGDLAGSGGGQGGRQPRRKIGNGVRTEKNRGSNGGGGGRKNQRGGGVGTTNTTPKRRLAAPQQQRNTNNNDDSVWSSIHDVEQPNVTRNSSKRIQAQALNMIRRRNQEHFLVLAEEGRSKEMARQIEYKFAINDIERRRLRKRHDAARSASRLAIQRLREDCELALAAKMADYGFLR